MYFFNKDIVRQNKKTTRYQTLNNIIVPFIKIFDSVKLIHIIFDVKNVIVKLIIIYN